MEAVNKIEIVERTHKLIKEMNTKQIDREELIQLLVLSLFSKKHIFLLGEPGVSKTGILEIFATAVRVKNKFQITIKNDTKYEEIFGDRYRDRDGKLHNDFTNTIIEAHFAIIDETWKGNSKIMNSFLSIMSPYRTVDIMGKGPVKVPLIMVGGASNELPIDKDVKPLRDRFQTSYIVQKITGIEDWLKFASRSYDRNPVLKTSFIPEEIHGVFAASQDVIIPEHIYNTLFLIRQKVVLMKLGVSERKFDGAIDMFKVSAYLNCREEVNRSELFLMKHMMWEEEKDIPIINKILNDEIYGQLDNIIAKLDVIKENQAKLQSFADGQLLDFLKFRTVFSYENVDNFERSKGEIQSLHKGYAITIAIIKEIENNYIENMNIEEELETNMFLFKFLSPVYTSLEYSTIRTIQNELIEKKNYYQQWLSDNSELHVYNQKVNKI